MRDVLKRFGIYLFVYFSPARLVRSIAARVGDAHFAREIWFASRKIGLRQLLICLSTVRIEWVCRQSCYEWIKCQV